MSFEETHNAPSTQTQDPGAPEQPQTQQTSEVSTPAQPHIEQTAEPSALAEASYTEQAAETSAHPAGDDRHSRSSLRSSPV